MVNSIVLETVSRWQTDRSLDTPLRWRKPKRVEVRHSMSDLFHEDVPDEFIDECFAMMAMADWHTFQVLTKRPERMLASALRLQERLATETPYLQAVTVPGRVETRTEAWWATGATDEYRWPLRNVWLGTSVEDQRAADERIPLLLQTPAAVRFLSCEPLLGRIDLTNLVVHDGRPGEWHIDALTMEDNPADDEEFRGATIDWVIAGGESGPNYRPMDLDWARSLRDQAASAGVAFFMKQLGAGTARDLHCRDRKGGNWDEWPPDLRIRQWPVGHSDLPGIAAPSRPAGVSLRPEAVQSR